MALRLRAPPRRIVLVAQLIGAALLVFFIGRELARQWMAVRAQPLQADLRVGDILLSGVIVLATYTLLVQTWRLLLAKGGASLSFARAARIWSVSNLWRYVPGKLWQIAAMAGQAQRENVPPAAAAGSAIISTILNIVTGIALMLVLGWREIERWRVGVHPVAIALLVVGVAGIVAIPYVVPRLGAMAARLTGRDVQLAAPSARALAWATAANLLSWILYGVAFMWLVRGVLGTAEGAPWQYVAVFTASYVVGYLFLFVPGGLGPRDFVMAGLLTSLGLAPPKEAVLVTAASRAWLTILEIVPGLLFLIHHRTRRPPASPQPPRPPSDVSTL